MGGRSSTLGIATSMKYEQCVSRENGPVTFEDDLFWSGGAPVEGANENNYLKQLYYNISDPGQQERWNKDPFLIVDFSNVDQKQDLLYAYQSSPTRFPTFSDQRAVCMFTSSTHPSAMLSNILMDNSQRIHEELSIDDPAFKLMEARLQSNIDAFNDKQGKDYGRQDEECEKITLPLINLQKMASKIEKEIGLSPSGLHGLLTKTLPALSRNVRDPYQSNPAKQVMTLNKLDDEIKKIREIYPKIFEISKSIYKTLFSLSDKLPKHVGKIFIKDQGENFGDYEETVSAASGGAVLGLSGLLNLVLGGVLARWRRNRRQGGDAGGDCCGTTSCLPGCLSGNQNQQPRSQIKRTITPKLSRSRNNSLSEIEMEPLNKSGVRDSYVDLRKLGQRNERSESKRPPPYNPYL